MTPSAIVVSDLGKMFRRYSPHRPRGLQEIFARGFRRIQPVERFWGLRDVSFTVPPGSMVGIVGANGSGKSTLLRLIGGIGRADTGRVEVTGRISALLNLSAGFHPDLTGRENTFVSGVLNGLTRRQVIERLEAIVAFAEIEEFIDNPVRTYSTGMQMRLAFSTAVHAEPDVLLIDEVLSVGDVAFQRKCLDRIAAFKARGCSIVLVSHDTAAVRDLCDEALWLNGGRLMMQGPSAEVVRHYLADMAARRQRQNDAAKLTPTVAR
jgi:lipopolysaccharide transport system ATP-binding protein